MYVMYNLICVHCSSRVRSIRHKLKYRKFCFNSKKLFSLEGDGCTLAQIVEF